MQTPTWMHESIKSNMWNAIFKKLNSWHNKKQMSMKMTSVRWKYSDMRGFYYWYQKND